RPTSSASATPCVTMSRRDSANPKSFVSIDESIPQADDRLDLPSGGSELAAKPADVHVDRARFDETGVAPDALEQPITRDDSVLVLRQIPQQLELAPCQPHGATVDRDRHALEVRDEVDARVAGDARLLHLRRAAQRRAN